MFFGRNFFSSHSKKQPTVETSSIEIKYLDVAYTIDKTIWTQKLLCDLSIHLLGSTKVYCDALNASYVAVNLYLA